jgi:3-hydroxymyristoyl/3-hydroxydecanoyl-(acyl carrier protein) dehydratase
MSEQRDIFSFIPQRPPFVFIDAIDERSEKDACTRYTIPETCPLLSDGILTLSGLMENAAQTCSVIAGNKIAYLGAVKQMEVMRFPHAGETLCTEALVKQQMLNISLIECTTRVQHEIIATTTLKIAIMDNNATR